MRNILDSAVNNIKLKSDPNLIMDYRYNFYPSSFGNFNNPELNRLGIEGDFRYNFFPFPAPNSFGKPKRKCNGYVLNKKTGNILKVYNKTDKNGIVKKVFSNGKPVNNRKVYKTKTAAKKAL